MDFLSDFRTQERKLRDAADDLSKAVRIDDLQDNPDNRRKLSQLLSAVQNSVNALTALLPTAGQSSIEFGNFFRTIGEAVRSSQRELDEVSRDYLKDPGALGPPTQFRIPRVSASMKFALAEQLDRKVNLVFYSTSSERKEEHQQSVDFEIVAVPAPPEWLDHEPSPRTSSELRPFVTMPLAKDARPKEPLSREPPIILTVAPLERLVLAPEERAHVFSQVEAIAPRAEAAKALLRRPDRVLIVEDTDERSFFLVIATKGAAADFEVYRLVLATKTLNLVYRWPKVRTERRPLAPLHEFLARLGRRQEQRLRKEKARA
jgi:hypothetical protein